MSYFQSKSDKIREQIITENAPPTCVDDCKKEPKSLTKLMISTVIYIEILALIGTLTPIIIYGNLASKTTYYSRSFDFKLFLFGILLGAVVCLFFQAIVGIALGIFRIAINTEKTARLAELTARANPSIPGSINVVTMENSAMERLFSHEKPIVAPAPKAPERKPEANEWKCSNCGRINQNYVGTCGCGQVKPR